MTKVVRSRGVKPLLQEKYYAATAKTAHFTLRKNNLASQRVFCTLILNLKQQHLIQLRAMHIKIIIRHHQQTTITIR